MKITENKIRTFTLELTEEELQTLYTAFGKTTHAERFEVASGKILGPGPAYSLYTEIGEALRGC